MSVLAMPMVLSAQELSDAAKVEFFDQKVYAILKDNCFKCHGEEKKLKGQFRLTSREGLLAGGEIGPAINLKEPQKSLLLDMLSYRDGDHEMPPKAKLPQAQIDVLTQWVKLGAPFKYHFTASYGNQGCAPTAAVREGDWKLIEWYEDGKLELFNLREDIGEKNDLAKKHPDKVKILAGKLAAWRKETGARMPTQNAKFNPDKREGR